MENNSRIQNSMQKRAANQAAPAQAPDMAKKSVAAMVNALMDKDGYKKRFEELLGARTAQFVGSIVSLINGDENLQQAFAQAPVTIIQSALRAATYDLPIDPGIGYAYIVPFNNTIKKDGQTFKRKEATFIMGYKGMLQLAMRTGAYSAINVVDIRAGELKSFNRLSEKIVLEFIEDEEERSKAPIIGYAGYFRLINGMEKTIYMTIEAIKAHELKHRKGQYMGKGWRDDFDAMCRKTVLRKLIGKWGIMSIDYQTANNATIQAASAIMTGQFDSEDDDENMIPGELEQEQPEGQEQQEQPSGPNDDAKKEPLPWESN